ncbi:MAG: OmpA family protein [Cyclobacteriaceae bacterium]|jgi:outer membrane protein OmpA-like peptidoglycan-associated protein|nr:OmpA family protein [Flammeovirgaceae bacterium]
MPNPFLSFTYKCLPALLFVFFSLGSHAQEKRESKVPLFVSHLSKENAAVTRRKGAPHHFFLTRLVCFNKKCRAFIGWRDGQRSRRYDYNKASKFNSKRTPSIDTVRIKQDKPIAKMPPKEKPKPTPPPAASDSVIVLGEVLFETNSYHLREEIYTTLDSIAVFLKKESKSTASISGHTDNTGKEDFNLELSSQRAEAVAEYLLDRGINPERISFIGFGNSLPIQPNDTPEGRRKNRRVEILIKRKNN